MEWIGVLLAVALVGTALAGLMISRWTRPEMRCPECASRRYATVSKEPLGMRRNDHSAGQHAGGLSAVVLIYKLSYRCAECGAGWSETITESS